MPHIFPCSLRNFVIFPFFEAYEQMARCFDRKANFQEYSSFFEKALEEKNKMAYKEVTFEKNNKHLG